MYWIKSSTVHHYWCPKHSNAHVTVFDLPSSWMIASNSKPQYWNFRDRRKKKDLCYGYLHSFEKGRVLPGLKQICSFLILHQCHISQSFQANRPHGICLFQWHNKNRTPAKTTDREGFGRYLPAWWSPEVAPVLLVALIFIYYITSIVFRICRQKLIFATTAC